VGGFGANAQDVVKGLIWLAMLAYVIWQITGYWRPPVAEKATIGSADGPAALAAYQQAAESFRHYSGLRFAQFALFVGIASAFAGALSLGAVQPYHRSWLAMTAMAVSGTFLVMHERAVDHAKQAVRTAIAFEAQSGARMFGNWKESRVVTATNAIRALHMLVGLLWLVVLG
jgi:hypothetical protein